MQRTKEIPATQAAALHVRRFGTGSVPVVAIHCALASGRAWEGLSRALPEATVTAFDLPGHGRSAAWPGCAQALAATSAADLAGPQGAHLIGHSFGATVALRAALDHPKRVQSLTLVEPVLFAALRGTADWDTLRRLQEPFETALRDGDRAKAARQFHRVWGGAERPFDALPAPVREGWIARIHLIGQQRAALEDDTGGLLRPGRLEGLTQAVTFLHGSESPAVIRAIEDRLAARLPSVRRLWVEGAGHMVAITHPEEVAKAIRATIGRPPSAP